MPEIISQEVIDACKKNDRKAQRTVYQSLFPSCLRVCKRYCPKLEEAMEILNTGFLKVFTQLEKFNHKGPFEGWVHRIMVNNALDHLRVQKKYNDHLVFPDKLEEYAEVEIMESEFADIELDTIYGMIEALPPVSRIVFNLYVFEDFSHAEIAHKLNISAGTSKWHLSHARKVLQEKVRAVYQKAQ